MRSMIATPEWMAATHRGGKSLSGRRGAYRLGSHSHNFFLAARIFGWKLENDRKTHLVVKELQNTEAAGIPMLSKQRP